MNKLTRSDIKYICPYQTNVALRKANAVLRSLRQGVDEDNIDLVVYGIAAYHKADDENIDDAFNGLMTIILGKFINEPLDDQDFIDEEKLNVDSNSNSSSSITSELACRALCVFSAKITRHFHINCIAMRVCANKTNKLVLTGRRDLVVNIAIILPGHPNKVSLTKLDLFDIAFDVHESMGIRFYPFPIWQSELEKYPGALSNPLLMRDIERNVK